jgi:hypothetical protein
MKDIKFLIENGFFKIKEFQKRGSCPGEYECRRCLSISLSDLKKDLRVDTLDEIRDDLLSRYDKRYDDLLDGILEYCKSNNIGVISVG